VRLQLLLDYWTWYTLQGVFPGSRFANWTPFSSGEVRLLSRKNAQWARPQGGTVFPFHVAAVSGAMQ